MNFIKKLINFIKEDNTGEDMVGDLSDITVTSAEIVRASITKYRKQYIGVLSIISFFEIVMIIRGLLYFDMTDIRRQMYMVCYIVLLVSSGISIFIMCKSYREGNVNKVHIAFVYAYSIMLTLWAAMISILDLMGGHTPIVFMTVIMGTAALSFLNQRVYISLVTVLSAVMIYCFETIASGAVTHAGYPINFVVFIVFVFFISSRQYRQNKLDYIVLKKLEAMSYHDQLTGLKNRFALQQELQNITGTIYFGIFDIDDFKKTNDVYGHDFGDKCLQEVAKQLKDKFGDRSFRYGGDEFVVISSERKEDFLNKCNDINDKLGEIFTEENIHISGGFYLPESSYESYSDYLKAADKALYKAKSQKKGTFAFYSGL